MDLRLFAVFTRLYSHANDAIVHIRTPQGAKPKAAVKPNTADRT
jgi:hypothetical protein